MNNISSRPWTFNQRDFKYAEELYKGIASEGITSLYIYDTNRDDFVSIPIIPDSVSASYNSSIQKTSSFGILRPLNFYVGGSAKTLSFSIDVHEDLNIKYQKNKVTRVGENLYDIIDIIKAMSEPIITQVSLNNNLLQAPKVYLQLGSQFAGLGHISTSISFSTPFRNNRYVFASISFTFTFHETFKAGDLTFEPTREGGVLTVGLSKEDLEKKLGVVGEDFKNLFDEYLSTGQILTRSYDKDKMYNIFAIMTELDYPDYSSGNRWVDQSKLRQKELEKAKANLDALVAFNDLDAITFAIEDGSFTKHLATLYVIMALDYNTSQILPNLNQLKIDISKDLKAEQAFLATLQPRDYDELTVWEQANQKWNTFYRWENKKHAKSLLLIEHYETLLTIVEQQIELYTNSGGEN